ncbi:yjeF N-terminal domain-containing protein 3 isoform X3 [Ornithorhynchus anatinus]|uniref:yjeF N-terminal domain-containing protein 3 isoform X3 n=1 Tax=Ornithorhynchus anatinus TaxID=9258 RepID=UPI0010A8B8E2|nr:yjeF N-terminal domain-containing protein 3 isoform X3 [Ornithorhynchus anatinus]
MSSVAAPEGNHLESVKYLSKVEAAAMEKELIEDYKFGRQQLVEICGHACAMAVTKEYEPTIFYPKRSLDALYRDFTTQCEKMDIPFLSYLPTEVQLINDAYNLVVDAILGPGVDPAEVKEPYTSILATLKQIKIPIVSLDIPSGWDVETGSDDGISPEVLVSLAAPKKCADRFSGKYHFVAGRFLPYDVQKKFDLNLPGYPGTECVVSL